MADSGGEETGAGDGVVDNADSDETEPRAPIVYPREELMRLRDCDASLQRPQCLDPAFYKRLPNSNVVWDVVAWHNRASRQNGAPVAHETSNVPPLSAEHSTGDQNDRMAEFPNDPSLMPMGHPMSFGSGCLAGFGPPGDPWDHRGRQILRLPRRVFPSNDPESSESEESESSVETLGGLPIPRPGVPITAAHAIPPPDGTDRWPFEDVFCETPLNRVEARRRREEERNRRLGQPPPPGSPSSVQANPPSPPMAVIGPPYFPPMPNSLVNEVLNGPPIWPPSWRKYGGPPQGFMYCVPTCYRGPFPPQGPVHPPPGAHFVPNAHPGMSCGPAPMFQGQPMRTQGHPMMPQPAEVQMRMMHPGHPAPPRAPQVGQQSVPMMQPYVFIRPPPPSPVMAPVHRMTRDGTLRHPDGTPVSVGPQGAMFQGQPQHMHGGAYSPPVMNQHGPMGGCGMGLPATNQAPPQQNSTGTTQTNKPPVPKLDFVLFPQCYPPRETESEEGKLRAAAHWDYWKKFFDDNPITPAGVESVSLGVPPPELIRRWKEDGLRRAELRKKEEEEKKKKKEEDSSSPPSKDTKESSVASGVVKPPDPGLRRSETPVPHSETSEPLDAQSGPRQDSSGADMRRPYQLPGVRPQPPLIRPQLPPGCTYGGRLPPGAWSNRPFRFYIRGYIGPPAEPPTCQNASQQSAGQTGQDGAPAHSDSHPLESANVQAARHNGSQSGQGNGHGQHQLAPDVQSSSCSGGQPTGQCGRGNRQTAHLQEPASRGQAPWFSGSQQPPGQTGPGGGCGQRFMTATGRQAAPVGQNRHGIEPGERYGHPNASTSSGQPLHQNIRLQPSGRNVEEGRSDQRSSNPASRFEGGSQLAQQTRDIPDRQIPPGRSGGEQLQSVGIAGQRYQEVPGIMLRPEQPPALFQGPHSRLDNGGLVSNWASQSWRQPSPSSGQVSWFDGRQPSGVQNWRRTTNPAVGGSSWRSNSNGQPGGQNSEMQSEQLRCPDGQSTSMPNSDRAPEIRSTETRGHLPSPQQRPAQSLNGSGQVDPIEYPPGDDDWPGTGEESHTEGHPTEESVMRLRGGGPTGRPLNDWQGKKANGGRMPSGNKRSVPSKEKLDSNAAPGLLGEPPLIYQMPFFNPMSPFFNTLPGVAGPVPFFHGGPGPRFLPPSPGLFPMLANQPGPPRTPLVIPMLPSKLPSQPGPPPEWAPRMPSSFQPGPLHATAVHNNPAFSTPHVMPAGCGFEPSGPHCDMRNGRRPEGHGRGRGLEHGLRPGFDHNWSRGPDRRDQYDRPQSNYNRDYGRQMGPRLVENDLPQHQNLGPQNDGYAGGHEQRHYGRDSDYDPDDEESEWFPNGPSSQNDMVEDEVEKRDGQWHQLGSIKPVTKRPEGVSHSSPLPRYDSDTPGEPTDGLEMTEECEERKQSLPSVSSGLSRSSGEEGSELSEEEDGTSDSEEPLTDEYFSDEPDPRTAQWIIDSGSVSCTSDPDIQGEDSLADVEEPESQRQQEGESTGGNMSASENPDEEDTVISYPGPVMAQLRNCGVNVPTLLGPEGQSVIKAILDRRIDGYQLNQLANIPGYRRVIFVNIIKALTGGVNPVDMIPVTMRPEDVLSCRSSSITSSAPAPKAASRKIPLPKKVTEPKDAQEAVSRILQRAITNRREETRTLAREKYLRGVREAHEYMDNNPGVIEFAASTQMAMRQAHAQAYAQAQAQAEAKARAEAHAKAHAQVMAAQAAAAQAAAMNGPYQPYPGHPQYHYQQPMQPYAQPTMPTVFAHGPTFQGQQHMQQQAPQSFHPFMPPMAMMRHMAGRDREVVPTTGQFVERPKAIPASHAGHSGPYMHPLPPSAMAGAATMQFPHGATAMRAPGQGQPGPFFFGQQQQANFHNMADNPARMMGRGHAGQQRPLPRVPAEQAMTGTDFERMSGAQRNDQPGPAGPGHRSGPGAARL